MLCVEQRYAIFMAQQFWVNNYFIDVTRNQIQHQQQATQLPPKALKVLEVLASRAGEVVSHDELMNLVWENSVVGPNTLQRAIAQLRKAFGDDSKQQAFIKTHSKQGYSLEANVRWSSEHEPTIDSEQNSTPAESPASLPAQNHKFGLYAAGLLIAFISWLLWPNSGLLFDKVTPLTASDEQEFNASYSPDGRYLVFNRFVSQCESHLWAKDLNNQQEIRISQAPGHYSPLSWSADGTQLTYVLMSECSASVQTLDQCWQLQTLDFAQAWNGNSQPMIRLDCAKIKTDHPQWLNDGRIAFLQQGESATQVKLMVFDPVSEQLANIKTETRGRIYDIDYSHKTDQFAVVTLTENNQHWLYTLTAEGTSITEAMIQKQPHHSAYEYFPLSFAPDGQHFLTEVGKQIYQLNLQGELSLIHPDNYRNLMTPAYHPNQMRFTATVGSKDFDVAQMALQQTNTDPKVFARSTAIEAYAQFQPKGQLIAFVSHRSGKRQLWLANNEHSYQITDFPSGLQNSFFSWSPDGQQLIVNVGDQAVKVDLDGNTETIVSDISINLIMPWRDPKKLLVTSSQLQQKQLFEIDITSGTSQSLSVTNVNWADTATNGQLVYLDNNNVFWLKDGDAKTPIPELENRLFGDRAVLKNNTIYGTDNQDQLWNYEISLAKFEVMRKMPSNISFVSDKRQNELLVTKFVGGRRELVEFSHEK